MCTVTWLRDGDGYQLFSNRDEKRTRRPSTGPQMLDFDDVRVVAPIDGDFGGTWIAANEFGLSLCLLNNGSPSSVQLSRGLLVIHLIPSRGIGELAQKIRLTELSDFAPFTLLALERRNPAMLFRWDGSDLEQAPCAGGHMVLASSSFDAQGVDAGRRREWTRLRSAYGSRAGTHLAFHRSHLPARGPYSPCMHREDAETVSFTWVSVTSKEINLYYAPGPPCSSLAGESLTLPLVEDNELAASRGCLYSKTRVSL